MCLSMTCSLSRYNAKGVLDCFNCKTGVFLRLFTSEAITIYVFAKKKPSTSIGIFNNKSPKGINVCAKEGIGVKWGQGGCLEVCQWPSDEEKFGAFYGNNMEIIK